jgi:hypothetical protein
VKTGQEYTSTVSFSTRFHSAVSLPGLKPIKNMIFHPSRHQDSCSESIIDFGDEKFVGCRKVAFQKTDTTEAKHLKIRKMTPRTL